MPNGEFNHSFKSIVPIVFSHGLTDARENYSVTAMELASHGYMVFLLDHHDGSCRYTENADNTKQWWFDTSSKDEKDFHLKVKKREQEVKELIDELFQTNFVKKTLKIQTKLILDKLIMSGHSMGGATALRVGNSDKRVKCILVNDPWLTPIKDEIKAKKFTFKAEQSLYITNTETFHTDTKCIDTNCILIQNLTPSHLEILQTNHCIHTHQNDKAITETFRLEWKTWLTIPRPYGYLLHQLHIWMWLSFLHRTGYHDGTFSLE